MPAQDGLRLPPPRPTLYPHRYFAPPQRRSAGEVDDPLLTRIVMALAPRADAARSGARLRPPPAAAGPRSAGTLSQSAREWNDLLGIWRHCDNQRCRLRHCCRGASLRCLPRYLPLVPMPVQVWFAAAGIAFEKELWFGDALALVDREDEQAVCARWHAAIERTLLPRSRRQRMNNL